MSTKTLFVGLPLILSMTACGSAVSPAETDAGAEQTDAAASVDAGTVDGPVADAAPPAPMIDEAFGSCTNPGPAGGLAGGDQLMRLDVDTGTFPNAVCNDGTPAVYYVRRATNPAHVDKWVLQLQGGGACSSPELCAQRWCSVSTNFGARKMSSSFAPERGINGRGVLANQADNPFNGWNHVFVYYCSSDSWSGTKGETTIEATHPVTGGAATSYRMHFNGAHIVESVVRTLRREAGNVTYEDAAMTVGMPTTGHVPPSVICTMNAAVLGSARSAIW